MSMNTDTEEGIFSEQWRSTTIAVMAAIGIVAYNNLAVSAALPEVGNDLGDVLFQVSRRGFVFGGFHGISSITVLIEAIFMALSFFSLLPSFFSLSSER